MDAGISCREIEKRMLRSGLSIRRVKAIFISHEHTDHIRGVAVLSKKYRLPVYITNATLNCSGLMLDESLVCLFSGFQTISIGNLQIKPFPKKHDAADPYSFVITFGKITVGVFTDIGVACENVVQHFGRCHAAFLEANYDNDMLDKGSYPFHLKRRIRGGNGHLSNEQALTLFKDHKPPFMRHLLLAHLSKNNNDPKLVQEIFDAHAGETAIIVASRYSETGVYRVDDLITPVAQPVYYQGTLF